MGTTFTCIECEETKPTKPDSVTIGYATVDADPSKKVCYECCATLDKAFMRETGRMTLYLNKREDFWTVGNWPGSMEIRCSQPQVGRHNIAGPAIRCLV